MTKDNNNKRNIRTGNEDSNLMPPPKKARGGDATTPSTELSNLEAASATVVTASTSSTNSVGSAVRQPQNPPSARDELSEFIGNDDDIIKDYLERNDRNEEIQEAADLAQQFSPPEKINPFDPVWDFVGKGMGMGIELRQDIGNNRPKITSSGIDFKGEDPREVLAVASNKPYEEKPQAEIESTYQLYKTAHESAQKGEILGPNTARMAQERGTLQQNEMEALDIAYSLNRVGKLSKEEAEEVAIADINIAYKHNTITPLVRYMYEGQNNSVAQR